MRLATAAILVMSATATAAPARWQRFDPPPAMPTPAATGTVEVDGANIYYATFGAGDPVILLHGGLGNGDQWANQVPALAGSHLVIAIDSRGQGRSTRTKAKPTYDQLASDVVAVMDKLALEKAAVVGWSDGGEIALKLAIHHAARVSKIFVFGANYNAKGNKPKKASATFAAYGALCRAAQKKLSTVSYGETAAWLAPIWKQPMGFTADQLRGIQVPAVIASGDHDELIAMAQVEEMAKLIPNARLVVFENASHFVHWQDPTTFNQVLVEFLAK